VQPFADAIAKMTGRASERAVRTPFGYHIIRFVDASRQAIAFEAVKARIIQARWKGCATDYQQKVSPRRATTGQSREPGERASAEGRDQDPT